MTTPQHRFLIIADGDFGPLTSKTANSCIRYFPERIVAVFDRTQAGKTVQQVLAVGGEIPPPGGVVGRPPTGDGCAAGGIPRLPPRLPPPPARARPTAVLERRAH